MAVDDTTNDILAGWFTKNECMYGYCKMMELLICSLEMAEAAVHLQNLKMI